MTAARSGRAVVVLTTASSRDEAERIATVLVEERLAACVNMVAVASTYRWQGAVERAEEMLLLIKTRRALVQRLGVRVRALHSYEVPELIALPVTAGARPYLAWMLAETARTARRASGARRR